MSLDESRREYEIQAQRDLMRRLTREREPVIHGEDLGLLDEFNRRIADQRPYGIQP